MNKQINIWIAMLIAGLAIGIWCSILDAQNPKYLFSIGMDTPVRYYFVLVPINLTVALASCTVVPITIASAKWMVARLVRRT